jgi:hypothetical protein
MQQPRTTDLCLLPDVRGLDEQAAELPRFSKERGRAVLRLGHALAHLPLTDCVDVIEHLLTRGVPEIGVDIYCNHTVPATWAQRVRGLERMSSHHLEGKVLGVLAHKRTPQWLTPLFYRLLAHVSHIERGRFDEGLHSLTTSGDLRLVVGRKGLGIELSSRRARKEGQLFRLAYPAPVWKEPMDFKHGERHALNVRDRVVVPDLKALGALPLSKEMFDFFDDGWHEFSGDLMRWFINGLVAEGKAVTRIGVGGALEVSL